MSVLLSMAKSFKKNYVLADPASNSAWQLLCTWDFSLTNERAVTQRKNNLSVQLKVRSFTAASRILTFGSYFPKCNLQFSPFLVFTFIIFPGVSVGGSPEGDADPL